MRLGFLSSILPDYSFNEVIELASKHGFACVEIACWPPEKASRRYAGVTHIDLTNLDNSKIAEIKDVTAKNNVEISGLAYYPNLLDPDPNVSGMAIQHLKKTIKTANKLKVPIVNTFIGKDRYKTEAENFKKFKEVWPDIIKLAEDHDITVCIENCPMYFSMDEWPGGNNLASAPRIWREMFSIIDSKFFALNYDPSHMILQQMDYINPIFEFSSKIKHFHIKDAKFHKEKYDEVGFLAPPLTYYSPKLPGMGDINWGNVVSALNDINYQGCSVIEIEDLAYENTLQDRLDAIALSKKYMNQYIL